MLRSFFRQLYRHVAERWSRDASSLDARGKALFRERRFAEAADMFRRAAGIEPRRAGPWNKLGFCLFECGRADEALDAFRRALEIDPDDPLTIQNFLFATNFSRETSAQVPDLHRRLAPRLAAAAPTRVMPHANTRDPDRPLRIGYLSADLRTHAVAYFVAPILAQHDRAAFGVYCYSNRPSGDSLTDRLRQYSSVWRDVAALSDAELAGVIRADGIDILVDLSGLTAGNRIGAVALQPAPVQISYLGYPATVGLPALGYRITDAYADIPGVSDTRYVEKLLRLPHCAWCFDPLRADAQVGAGGARSTPILFGSLNSVTKLSPETLELWAQVLRDTPGSRIHLSRVPEGRLREELASRLVQRGLNAARIEFSGIVPVEDFAALIRRVDIALDPFPCNGGVTTCETLWNGTPLVALIGDTFASRASYSVLANGGLAEFAAASPADYVRLAGSLAADPSLRDGVRARVAGSFRNSSVMRAPQFTRDFEALLRDAWRDWCSRPAAG